MLLYVKQLLSRNVENTVVCRAKIATVYHDEGWNYFACPTCRKKPNQSDGRYWCKRCRVFVALPILRYMIQIRIKDAFAETNATVSQEASIELVGMTSCPLLVMMLITLPSQNLLYATNLIFNALTIFPK